VAYTNDWANAFLGEWGDNSVQGNHKGLPVQNGQMQFLGNGRMPFARTKWGIRPDGQTWGDKMGGMHFIGKKGIRNFGEWGDNSVQGNHKGLPVQNGQMRFWGKGERGIPK